MNYLDWLILVATMAFISIYGMWRNRRSQNIGEYLLANRSLKWYSVALSIVATQASAITFLSAPGQAYFDGLRFIQIYFGLPLAMIVIAWVFLPRFYQWNVITAYQYIEQKFDVKVRLLTACLFLIQRGLAAGLVISAPSLILSHVLGWNFYLTVLLMGGVVVAYTTIGGSAAVSQTQFQQMLIILGGMAVAAGIIIHKLPENVSLSKAISFADNMGKMNALDFSFDWHNKYTVWSGLLGGFFLSLSYFGADQSQVERYLSGQSMEQSQKGLFFNALFKIPMQFFILMIGVLLFVFYQFEKPPIYFNTTEVEKIKNSSYQAEFQTLQNQYDALFEQQKTAVTQGIEKGWEAQAKAQVKANQDSITKIRKATYSLIQKNNPLAETEQNYMFLSFVMNYLPHGLIGLLIAVIFFASMSTTAAELNALASVSIVDIYQRVIAKDKSDAHYVFMSRLFTVIWAALAVSFAMFAHSASTLIEAINLMGSLFYGTILGIFLLVFFSKNLASNAVFLAAIISQILVFLIHLSDTFAYLWYNLIGCVVTVVLAYLLNLFFPVLPSDSQYFKQIQSGKEND
ncbi:MAG: sodium:solute symporter [Bacteroidia bacterium]